MQVNDKALPLTGYSDRLSLRPGETIGFKVSSQTDNPVKAWLTRSISADPNPAGQGIVELPADQYFSGHEFTGRNQSFSPGSYAICNQPFTGQSDTLREFQVIVYPTLHKQATQTIASVGGIAIRVTDNLLVVFTGDEEIATDIRLKLRQWQHIQITVDPENYGLEINCNIIGNHSATQQFSGKHTLPALQGKFMIAAELAGETVVHHFNGKIEAPQFVVGNPQQTIGWDFSRDIPRINVPCDGTSEYDLELVNFPARGMTGSKWDGSEMCWRHALEHYAAIHFHETDIYDFDWQTDFTFIAPDDLPSGVYIMHIRSGDHADAMPFYVCAPFQKPAAKLCLLVPTFTYLIYGNHARPDYQPEWKKQRTEWNAYPHNPAEFPQYGLSTYNYHPDHSGICHASHLRPLLNLRPGYLTFNSDKCSGLRHMQADSHLIAWLHEKGIEFDIITDKELHDEGVAAIEKYQCVMTPTHPEYHTPQTLDALQSYRDHGGNFIYLGGNGFYWRIVSHPQHPGLFEIRRAEDGIRAWAAEVGEYYHAFDGSYGGLWRRNGRPPQMLCGVGFSAQGEFNGSYYKKTNFDPALEWIFAGIEGDIIGDFGYSGGGAAGFELDRADTRLGTPETATVVASSEGHGKDFVLVPEEQLTHITTLPGEPLAELIRADMVYFELPGGGSVFSTGSITFCGSLPWNAFDNNVSTLLENVVVKMTGDSD